MPCTARRLCRLARAPTAWPHSVGCAVAMGKKKSGKAAKSKAAEQSDAETKVEAPKTPWITAAEVEERSKPRKAEKDAQAEEFIIHGKVYNITEYRNEHPGGSEIFKEVDGKDATSTFEEYYHSKDAREIVKKYEVGTVKGTTKEDWDKLDSAEGGGGGGGSSLIIPLLVIIIAVLWKLEIINFGA